MYEGTVCKHWLVQSMISDLIVWVKVRLYKLSGKKEARRIIVLR